MQGRVVKEDLLAGRPTAHPRTTAPNYNLLQDHAEVIDFMFHSQAQQEYRSPRKAKSFIFSKCFLAWGIALLEVIFSAG